MRDLKNVKLRLEQHYRDMCDLEFTVEEGRMCPTSAEVGDEEEEGACVDPGRA
jgi:hypothetical protein